MGSALETYQLVDSQGTRTKYRPYLLLIKNLLLLDTLLYFLLQVVLEVLVEK
jgi:hypothetical protein